MSQSEGLIPPFFLHLHGHLGDDWLVHERVPPLLDLEEGEVTRELDAAVDGGQVQGRKAVLHHVSPFSLRVFIATPVGLP